MQYIINDGSTVFGTHRPVATPVAKDCVLTAEVYIDRHPKGRGRCSCGRRSHGVYAYVATRGNETSVYALKTCGSAECVIGTRVCLWGTIVYDTIPGRTERYSVSFSSTKRNDGNAIMVQYALEAADMGLKTLVQFRYSPSNLVSSFPFYAGLDQFKTTRLLGAFDDDVIVSLPEGVVTYEGHLA